MVSKIYPGQDFIGQGDYDKVNQGHTTTCHTYTPYPMSPPSINFLHLRVPEIQPGHDFIGQGHYGKVKG